MPSPDKIQTAWVDIPALPAPVEEISILLIALNIGLVLIVLFALYYLWQQPKFRALRKIRSLHKQPYSSRQKLFLLNHALLQGLQVTQLQKLSFDSHQQSEWQAFCRQLVHFCYQESEPASEDVQHLASQASYWIKQA